MASSKPSASKASTEKQPTLNTIYKAYGGRQKFLLCHGLKPWNYEDVEEGEAIAAEMLKGDAESEAENVSTQASAVENRDHSHLQDRRYERVGYFEVQNRGHSHLQDRRYERVGYFEVQNRDRIQDLQDKRYERAGAFEVENRDRIQGLQDRRYERAGVFEVENRDRIQDLQDRRYERAGTFEVENRDHMQDLNNFQE